MTISAFVGFQLSLHDTTKRKPFEVSIVCRIKVYSGFQIRLENSI